MRMDAWLAKHETSVDWDHIYDEWQIMQEIHNPWRDQQVDTILRVLKTLPFPKLTVLDLCCGPGTLSETVLTEIPQAEMIAVDADPFLLAVYRQKLANFQGRFQIIRGDIRSPELYEQLSGIHAVVSLTALHWLSAANQEKLYRRICQCLTSGGVFLNGDRLNLSADFFRHVDYQLPAKHSGPDWATFWTGIREKLGIQAELEEIRQSFGLWEGTDDGYSREFYLEALQNAGFSQTEVIFQAGDRVVYGGLK